MRTTSQTIRRMEHEAKALALEADATTYRKKAEQAKTQAARIELLISAIKAEAEAKRHRKAMRPRKRRPKTLLQRLGF